MERSLSRTPVFQVMHSYQGEVAAREPVSPSTAATKTTVDLTLMSGEQDGALILTFFYNTDLFDHALVEQLAHHLARVIELGGGASEQSLAALPLLDPDERQRVLVEWNATARAFAADTRGEALVARHAQATPDAIALEHRGTPRAR